MTHPVSPSQTRLHDQAVLSPSTDTNTEARLSIRCLLERSSLASVSAMTAQSDVAEAAASVHVCARLFEEGIMPPPSTVPCREPPHPHGVGTAIDATGVPEAGGGLAARNQEPVAQASCATAGSHVGVYLKVNECFY